MRPLHRILAYFILAYFSRQIRTFHRWNLSVFLPKRTSSRLRKAAEEKERKLQARRDKIRATHAENTLRRLERQKRGKPLLHLKDGRLYWEERFRDEEVFEW